MILRGRRPGALGGSVSLSAAKFGLKVLVVGELLSLGVCYFFYRKINRDPEFRYRLLHGGSGGSGEPAAANPVSRQIVEAYYQLGETLADTKDPKYIPHRELDRQLWRSQGKDV